MTTESLIKYQIEKNPFSISFSIKGKDVLTLSTFFQIKDFEDTSNGFRAIGEQAVLAVEIQENRLDIQWKGDSVENRFFMEGYWYGVGELVNQRLVLNDLMLPLDDFITSDLGRTGLSNIMTPAWMNDRGVLILARTPVKVGSNQPSEYIIPEESLLGDQISFDELPQQDPGGQGDKHLTLVGDNLSFVIYLTESIISAQKTLVREVGHPTQTPPVSLFDAPVWTTWAQYKDLIDQETVLDFANQIVSNNFPHHVLEIDDRWQTQYGDLVFDPDRFPDPKGMIARLHKMGFKVTTWVIPFIHRKAQAAEEAVANSYVVKHQNGEPYLIKWWQGWAYLLDPTNPAAMDWFGERLKKLQDEVGLDGFKFDGGEAEYVPEDAIFHKPIQSRNEYSRHYVNWVSENFSICEVRTGWFNQTSPILFRVWDLWSSWSHANGLRSIIPATLSLSLTGYPFTFPDMIGGNGYFTFPNNKLLKSLIFKVIIPFVERSKKRTHDDEDVAVHASDVPGFIQKMPMFGWPTKELMIRWTQLNALMPVMQFSITPWQFGEECTSICRKYTELHREFAGLFEKLAVQTTKTGEPIIKPVFWLAPTDPNALTCDDQFLVGDDLLVAPVVHNGLRERDIYLPPGSWQDYWGSEIFEGPTILEKYPSPLDVLPIFKRV